MNYKKYLDFLFPAPDGFYYDDNSELCLYSDNEYKEFYKNKYKNKTWNILCTKYNELIAQYIHNINSPFRKKIMIKISSIEELLYDYEENK